MPVFAYTAIDAKGKRTSGTVPAPSRAAALEAVIQQGLVPASVQEQAVVAARQPLRLPGSGRVSQADV